MGDTKICLICNKEKSVEAFKRRDGGRGRPRSECRECSDQFLNNSGSTSVRESRRRDRRALNAKWLADYFKTHPCLKCGYSNILALDFHHRNPEEKQYAISDLVHRGRPLKKMMKEIEKCDVLCANCHRIETAQQQNRMMLQFA